jgi:hypothetical protein
MDEKWDMQWNALTRNQLWEERTTTNSLNIWHAAPLTIPPTPCLPCLVGWFTFTFQIGILADTQACQQWPPMTLESQLGLSFLDSPDVETPVLNVGWQFEWMCHIVLEPQLECRVLGCSCCTVGAETDCQIFPLSNQVWSPCRGDYKKSLQTALA